MKKRLAAILLMVFALMITGCGNSNSAEEPAEADSQMTENVYQTGTEGNTDISIEEAENTLQEYLISVNNWESNYVLEPIDPVLGEIENKEIFRFEIRYADDTDEVGGRLIDNYAITTDGERIFWYNPADDEWVQQIGNGVVDNAVLDQDMNAESIIESEETPSEEDDKIEISMEDVIYIGIDEATKYYDDLQLTSVYSYDNDNDRSVVSGDDGKREWWYVNFANEKNNYVSIMIVDGEVTHVEHFDQNGNNRLIDMDDVNMTADEAVQRAKDYGLAGGDPDNESHWVSGYNFKMSCGSLVSSPNDYRILLEVIGISPNGNFAHIDFDATTGELLLAEEEIEYSNGDIEWKSFN